MKALIKSWDLERSLLFASMILASYGWIITERLLLGIAIGIAFYALQIAVHEAFASRFGWQSLATTDSVRRYLIPHFKNLISKTQRA